METVKIGNTEFNVEFIKGKTLEQLESEFPSVRKEVLTQVAQKFGVASRSRKKK